MISNVWSCLHIITEIISTIIKERKKKLPVLIKVRLRTSGCTGRLTGTDCCDVEGRLFCGSSTTVKRKEGFIYLFIYFPNCTPNVNNYIITGLRGILDGIYSCHDKLGWNARWHMCMLHAVKLGSIVFSLLLFNIHFLVHRALETFVSKKFPKLKLEKIRPFLQVGD